MAKKTSDPFCVEKLEKLLTPDTTVYTSLRRVSASGMTRWYEVYVVDFSDTYRPIRRITGTMAFAYPNVFTYDDKHEAIKLGGCGFDGGHDLVYSLQHLLGVSLFKENL